MRHGETVANLQKVIQGQRPGELSSQGHHQAYLLGERLKPEKLDHLWASPLTRVSDTVAAVTRHHSLPIVTLPELMERNFGVLEGKSFAEYFLTLEQSGLPFFLFRPPGGESIEEVEERLAHVVERLDRVPQGESLLIAAHSVINKVLLKILLAKNFDDWDTIRQDNSCVNILQRNPLTGRMEAELLNCTRHLYETARFLN